MSFAFKMQSEIHENLRVIEDRARAVGVDDSKSNDVAPLLLRKTPSRSFDQYGEVRRRGGEFPEFLPPAARLNHRQQDFPSSSQQLQIRSSSPPVSGGPEEATSDNVGPSNVVMQNGEGDENRNGNGNGNGVDRSSRQGSPEAAEKVDNKEGRKDDEAAEVNSGSDGSAKEEDQEENKGQGDVSMTNEKETVAVAIVIEAQSSSPAKPVEDIPIYDRARSGSLSSPPSDPAKTTDALGSEAGLQCDYQTSPGPSSGGALRKMDGVQGDESEEEEEEVDELMEGPSQGKTGLSQNQGQKMEIDEEEDQSKAADAAPFLSSPDRQQAISSPQRQGSSSSSSPERQENARPFAMVRTNSLLKDRLFSRGRERSSPERNLNSSSVTLVSQEVVMERVEESSSSPLQPRFAMQTQMDNGQVESSSPSNSPTPWKSSKPQNFFPPSVFRSSGLNPANDPKTPEGPISTLYSNPDAQSSKDQEKQLAVDTSKRPTSSGGLQFSTTSRQFVPGLSGLQNPPSSNTIKEITSGQMEGVDGRKKTSSLERKKSGGGFKGGKPEAKKPPKLLTSKELAELEKEEEK